MLSLSFDLGGMVSGAILAVYFDVFSTARWAIALFPGILSVRGAIGGVFSGRLTTGLHLGTIEPSYAKNTKIFYLLLDAIVVLSSASGVVIGLGAWIFGLFLWEATVENLIEVLAEVTATMGFSMVFIPPITMAVSIVSFRRGLNPDIIVYPVISTAADIIVTACFILCLSLFFSSDTFGHYLIALLDFIFLFTALRALVRNLGEERFARTVKEFLLTLSFVTLVVGVTGTLLIKVNEVIGTRAEIYVVYPALIDTLGDVGSIIGSTVTTNLALGLVEPSVSSIKQHSYVICGGWMASTMMFTIYFMTASFASRATGLNGVLKLAAQLLATNILAVSVMVLVAYAVAISTYRRGWDPDNFVIPIESSLADSATTLSLLLAVALIA